MAKVPFLLTCFILVYLIAGARILELGSEKPEAALEKTHSLVRSSLSSRTSSSTARTQNSRRKRCKDIVVDYTHLEQGIEISLPKLYGDFIEGLGLSSSERRYFDSLLVERLLTQQQFGMEMVTCNPQERPGKIEIIEKHIADNNRNIKSFLNHPEDYLAFINYEKRHPERQNLEIVRAFLTGLSEESETQLIDILYQCRLEVEGDRAHWKTILPDENLQQTLENWRRCDDKIAQYLPSIFLENQINIFLKYWRIARDHQKRELLSMSELHERGG